MVQRRDVLRSVTTAGIIGLAGCSGQEGKPGVNNDPTPTIGSTGGAQSGSSDFVRVGSLHPQSPPLASMGKGARNAMKLTVKKLNSEGGINGRDVKAFYGDTEVNPETAREEARRLVENKNIDFLIGGISSAIGLALQDFATSHDLPFFTVGSADAHTGDSCNQMTFSYNYNSTMTTNAMAPWMTKQSGTKGWIHVADYAWGNSFLNGLQNALGDSAEVIKVTKTSLGTTDYSNYISQISASDADWVATALSGTDAVNFLKQANQYGLKENKDIYSPVNFYRTIRQGAGSAAVGTYANIRYSPNWENEVNQDFVSRFNNEYGTQPNQMGEHVWTTMHAFAQAAKNAGTISPMEVTNELAGMEFTSPMAKNTYFRECDHNAVRDVHLGEIVAPSGQDYPSVKITDSVSAEEVMRSCEETGCNL